MLQKLKFIPTPMSALVIAALPVVVVLGQEASSGWRIPPNAAGEVSPIAATDEVMAKGKRIYESKCRRCHGPAGTGNGPDADPDHKPQDLTDPSRAARNPDGVMFYKVWNGRSSPKMPAFKTDLSREDVWTVIHYVKTLRRASSH